MQPRAQLVARTCTTDRDVRFAMERLAGDYLTATGEVLVPEAAGLAVA